MTTELSTAKALWEEYAKWIDPENGVQEIVKIRQHLSDCKRWLEFLDKWEIKLCGDCASLNMKNQDRDGRYTYFDYSAKISDLKDAIAYHEERLK